MSNVGVFNDNYFAFDDNLRRQLKALSDISYKTMTDNINRQFKALSDIPNKAMTDNVNRQLKALSDIPYKTMIDNINRQLKTLSDIPYKTMTDNMNYQLQEITKIIGKTFVDDNFNNLVKNVIETNNNYSDSFDGTYSIDSVTNDEVMEVSNDLKLIVSDRLNWQQKIANTLTKWKEKNPVIAFLLNNIIIVIIVGLITSYFYSAVTSKKSSVKVEPQYGSPIVCKIEINKDVTVISDVPYYYEIKFIDQSDGQTKTGWISKRSVKIIENATLEENVE